MRVFVPSCARAKKKANFVKIRTVNTGVCAYLYLGVGQRTVGMCCAVLEKLMLYHMYEAMRVAMGPLRLGADFTKHMVQNPLNPFSYTHMGKQAAAALDVFEHATRRYGKPTWDLDTTVVDGQEVAVSVETALRKKFCKLLHFDRATPADVTHPKLMIVAPLSGHYATLLRGTVEAMLPEHDVYITDWRDARMVPMTEGTFDLDDYIDYLIEFFHFLGPNTHVLAVCQPAVPVMAAACIMSQLEDPCRPTTMTLIGGPIDTREGVTEVNKLALEHPLEWFRKNVVVQVPPPYPGAGRLVYPGFIQLTNFMAMNLDRHMSAHKDMFDHLVVGDDDNAEKRKEFYEEYRAVLDLTAEFYLQTVDTVFQKHSLPRGEMTSRWRPVLPDKVTDIATLCIEGELDDISGVGQTKAAHTIMTNLPDSKKRYHLQKGAGHYGVFNGSKFRRDIVPVITQFIREFDLAEEHGRPSLRVVG